MATEQVVGAQKSYQNTDSNTDSFEQLPKLLPR